jgi:hypothetical protein
MIHEPALVDALSEYPVEHFEGEVFRAVRLNADPLASSVNGGRWSPGAGGGSAVPVLYTSFVRDGALAEVVSYLAMLSPLPKGRPLKVARLSISASKTVRLVRADLAALGVDHEQYGTRDYARTQAIGAALNFLEVDGLIAPSARWECDNISIFSDNHSASETLQVLDEEEVDWVHWAASNGFL